MQIGTEILIERMNTHPEEFENGVLSKWARIMDMAHDFLPDEDKAAIKEAHNKTKIDYFNGEVLATLAGEREMLGVGGSNRGATLNQYYSTGQQSISQQMTEQQMMAQQSRAVNAMQQSPYGNALGSNSALGSKLF